MERLATSRDMLLHPTDFVHGAERVIGVDLIVQKLGARALVLGVQ